MVPALKEEEMFEGVEHLVQKFEGVEHLVQSHPASKWQNQDACLGFLMGTTLSSSWKPLSLDKGIMENRCQKSVGPLGSSGRGRGEHQWACFH